MGKKGLAVAGLALVLALTGCGKKEQGQAVGGDSAPGESSLFGSALDLGSAVTEQSKGKQSTKMTFEATIEGMTMKGDGALRVNGNDVAMRLSMNVGGMGSIEMVLLDKALYMKLPAEAKGKTGLPDKPWVKFTPGGTDPVSRALEEAFGSIGDTADPTKTMEQIQKAGTITKSAKEQLNGKPVTHYWVTVDFAKLAAANPDPKARKALEQAEKAGMKSMDMEVWIDGANLPAQMAMDIPAQPGKTARMTMGFSDWGQPVDIKAPPADQVGEFKPR